MHEVIVLDTLAQEGLDLLAANAQVKFEVRTGLKGAELHDALGHYDGAICRSGVQITADALEGNRRLKAIVRAGVGVDNIDLRAATRQGIVVMNTPAGNTLSTAEHTIAMMLALARNIAPACQSLFEGRWERNKFMGTQLADKVLGVVGLGRIGQEVAARAKAFQMSVVGYDPFMSQERAHESGIETVRSVKEMLPQVDFLTVHTPLNDETRNMIGAAEIAMMRPGVRLINCARGGIFNEDALVEGLRSGRLGGVALDVFTSEPCKESPLFGMKGVVVTPHLGASTEEAQSSVAVEGVALLVDYLTRGAIRHAVNMIPLDPKQLEGLRGYLDVAYRLGMLHAQMAPGPPTACKLLYRGDVAGRETKLVTAAFAAGLLTGAMDEPINIVNAEVLLRERGIELVEQSSLDKGDFSSLISAEVRSRERAFVAAGTVFGNKLVRLVRLGDHRLEAYLDGILMIFTHRDVPGIIGKVGTIFGVHHVNIAQMSVGRADPGGAAIGVMNLDAEPPAAALDEVLHHPDIESVRIVRLPAAGELPPWMIG